MFWIAHSSQPSHIYIERDIFRFICELLIECHSGLSYLHIVPHIKMPTVIFHIKWNCIWMDFDESIDISQRDVFFFCHSIFHFVVVVLYFLFHSKGFNLQIKCILLLCKNSTVESILSSFLSIIIEFKKKNCYYICIYVCVWQKIISTIHV